MSEASVRLSSVAAVVVVALVVIEIMVTLEEEPAPWPMGHLSSSQARRLRSTLEQQVQPVRPTQTAALAAPQASSEVL